MTALAAAIGDCTFVVAATARNHDQAKPVIGAAAAAAEMAPRMAAGETVAVVFGRERNGLEIHEVARADRILTLPVNPAFASLNLAQAVVIVGYEWFKQAGGGLPFAVPDKSPPVGQAATRRLLCRPGARTRQGRIFPARREARRHERQSAQYLPAHGALATGHAHAAWRGHRAGAGPQRSGARRRARRRRRAKAARSAGRARRRPRAVRAHALARPAAACCGAIRPTPNARFGRG